MLSMRVTTSPIRRIDTSKWDGCGKSSRRRLIAGTGRVRRARPIDCLGPLVDGYCSDTLSLKQQDAECDEDQASSRPVVKGSFKKRNPTSRTMLIWIAVIRGDDD